MLRPIVKAKTNKSDGKTEPRKNAGRKKQVSAQTPTPINNESQDIEAIDAQDEDVDLCSGVKDAYSGEI